MNRTCTFCMIGADASNRNVVAMDDRTMTLIDPGSPHHGHFLVMPRNHFRRIRDMDEATIDALIFTVGRVVRSIEMAFPDEEISVWKSADHAQHHMHFHVHLGHRTHDKETSCCNSIHHCRC